MESNKAKRKRPERGFYAILDDVSPSKSIRVERKRLQKADKTKLYPIEIVERDKAQNKVKVHYIGYSAEDDEWRSCDELKANRDIGRVLQRYVPGRDSLEERAALFFDRLRRKIKMSLFSSKRESPEIRVEQEIEMDIYEHYFKRIGDVKIDKGRAVHCVHSPADPALVDLLGEKWSERILNINNDFSFVTKGTIQFWTHTKAAIKEFVNIGGNLYENQIENEIVLVFTFVRGDGVKQDYVNEEWKC